MGAEDCNTGEFLSKAYIVLFLIADVAQAQTSQAGSPR